MQRPFERVGAAARSKDIPGESMKIPSSGDVRPCHGKRYFTQMRERRGVGNVG